MRSWLSAVITVAMAVIKKEQGLLWCPDQIPKSSPTFIGLIISLLSTSTNVQLSVLEHSGCCPQPRQGLHIGGYLIYYYYYYDAKDSLHIMWRTRAEFRWSSCTCERNVHVQIFGGNPPLLADEGLWVMAMGFQRCTAAAHRQASWKIHHWSETLPERAALALHAITPEVAQPQPQVVLKIAEPRFAVKQWRMASAPASPQT